MRFADTGTKRQVQGAAGQARVCAPALRSARCRRIWAAAFSSVEARRPRRGSLHQPRQSLNGSPTGGTRHSGISVLSVPECFAPSGQLTWLTVVVETVHAWIQFPLLRKPRPIAILPLVPLNS